jgi:hypothetical protein
MKPRHDRRMMYPKPRRSTSARYVDGSRMLTHSTVRLMLSIMLITGAASACSRTTWTQGASLATSAPSLAESTNSATPSRSLQDAGSPTPLPDPSDPIVTIGPVAGMRAQFGRFQGGDTYDPCGVSSGAFQPEVEPPYLGDEWTFFGGEPIYPIGHRLYLCAYGFEPRTPIQATVTEPDGTEHRQTIVIQLNGGSNCSTLFGDCRSNEYWYLPSPIDNDRATWNIKGRNTHGQLTAVLAGWVLPGSITGEHLITAKQGRRRAESTIVVEQVSEPTISVGRWLEDDGQPGFAAMLAGFAPHDDVQTYLYRAYGSTWKLVGEAWSITTSESGDAIHRFRAPPSLSSGRYCLVAEQTIPSGDPSRPSPDGEVTDPCFVFGQFDAGFDIP